MKRLYESPTSSLTRKSSKTLSGLFAECGVRNQNDRIYPRDIYLPALEELMPKIESGRLLGECDHPTDRDEIFLSNASHVIKECKIKGDKIYGSIELLDTPSGKIAQALVEAGIPLGISSRAVGNTKSTREGEEVTDLKLITFDIVADPSFSNAILTESAKVKLSSRLDSVASSLPLNESVCDNNNIRERINTIKESLNKAPTVTSKLVESIGELTTEKSSLKKSLSESKSRNKSLKENMSRLQDSYNTLFESVEVLESKHHKEVTKYKDRIKSLKESYAKKVSDKDSENLRLRKELAIEKRGLSVDKMMPILEGLTTDSEIAYKLDTVKNLGVRKYKSVDAAKVALTEDTTIRKKSRLSSIISNV